MVLFICSRGDSYFVAGDINPIQDTKRQQNPLRMSPGWCSLTEALAPELVTIPLTLAILR